MIIRNAIENGCAAAGGCFAGKHLPSMAAAMAVLIDKLRKADPQKGYAVRAGGLSVKIGFLRELANFNILQLVRRERNAKSKIN